MEEERDRRAPLALFLAAVAGAVDAVGYLLLAHVFVANMSGNSVKLGVALARRDLTGVWRDGLPVLTFVCGVFCGVAAGELASRRGRPRIGPQLAAESALLLGAALAAFGERPSRGFDLRLAVLLVLLVAAMSMQTAALQRVAGRTVRTTYVTGMLTNLATDLAVRLTRREGAERAPLAAGVWLSYLAGAVAGGAGGVAWGGRFLFVPLGLLLAPAAWEWRRA